MHLIKCKKGEKKMSTVTQVLNLLLSLIPADFLKEVLDSVFDKIEDKVASTENQWDDAVILPLINKARELLNVPDND